MKKVLILTATAGQGHNSVSKALAKKFPKEEFEVHVVDFYKICSSSSKRWIMDSGYKIACKYFRPLYNSIYRSLKDKENGIINKQNINKLKELIIKIDPDIIIAPHVFVATNLAYLKKHFHFRATTYFIVTDYCLYPYVTDTKNLDYIILPHKDFVPQFLEKGFLKKQLLPYGIPVDERFSISMDKLEIRKKLGLKNKFTVLVMTGGGGFGNIVQLLKKTVKSKANIQILCLNGKDEQSLKLIQNYIERNEIDNITNLGFVDDVVPYMKAADCMVGKCGAINLNEAMNACVPLICSKQLAYQELENYNFLSKYNAIIGYKTFSQLPSIIRYFAENPEMLNAIKNNLPKVRSINAVNDIVKFIINESENKN